VEIEFPGASDWDQRESRMNPLKIAYLSSVYPRATDTFVRIEVEYLRKMGVEVHTFSVRRPPADQVIGATVKSEAKRTRYLLHGRGLASLLGSGMAAAIVSPLRLLSVAGLIWRTGATGIRARIKQVAYVLEATMLARHLKQIGIHHLHNHIGMSSAHVAMLASKLSGIPYSMTIHGPAEFFAAEDQSLSEKIVRSAFTVCISEFCRSQCMIFTPHSDWNRLKIVRCAVGPEFLEAEAIPPPATPRFVCVGRLGPEKGHLQLLEAAGRLARDGLHFELVIIGDGELRSELEAKVEREGLESRVRLTGWLDSRQVREQILASSFLVVPSFAEGLPVVVMEALALRRPVISSRIAGIPELVVPGECGWLVPAGSVEALESAMRTAIETPATEHMRMGESGFGRVLERHDPATEVGKLADLFRASALDAENP
jgi:colanic acid/amylovoran biosynthesis glycosyltransferase